MVIAYHVIFATYGFWLPNDPRGSNSEFVRSRDLLKFGNATKTFSRASVARNVHDFELRMEAKKSLRYEPVRLTGIQARGVGRGFGEVAKTTGGVIYACAILPEHVHMVIARHSYRVEQLINLLKGGATRSLLKEQLHPFQVYHDRGFAVPTMWGRNCRKVFIDSVEKLRDKIEYVDDNPLKEGKPRQSWGFVTEFR